MPTATSPSLTDTLTLVGSMPRKKARTQLTTRATIAAKGFFIVVAFIFFVLY